MSNRHRPFLTSPHLIGLMIVTARLVQDQVANRLTALGISYAQAAVLIHLYRSASGSLAQSDMVESLVVSRASGTLVLAQLEGRGLVSRSADPADARRQVIALTEAGRELEQPVYDIFDEVESLISRSLEPDEMRAAFQTVHRMLEDVRHHRGMRM